MSVCPVVMKLVVHMCLDSTVQTKVSGVVVLFSTWLDKGNCDSEERPWHCQRGTLNRDTFLFDDGAQVIIINITGPFSIKRELCNLIGLVEFVWIC